MGFTPLNTFSSRGRAREDAGKVRGLAPYSRSNVFAKLDGRSREAVFMRRVRKGLLDHVGNKPTVVQRMLIDRGAVLALRLAMLDEKIIADRQLNEHDNNHIVAWQNALTRILVALGVHADAAPALPSLADHISALARGDEAA